MKFDLIFEEIRKGKKFRRKKMKEGIYFQFQDFIIFPGIDLMEHGISRHPAVFYSSDILADDWEIIE